MIARTPNRPQPIPFGHPSAAGMPPPRPKVAPARRGLGSPQTPSGTRCAKFLGQGTLSVQSSLTGRLYRFQGYGHSLAIDARDALMLGRIPDLMLL